jgi:hypothetical protein
MSKKSRNFDLEERLIDFAVRVIRTAESLPKSRVGIHIAGQLVRSGTHRRRIMEKRKALNPAWILSIK